MPEHFLLDPDVPTTLIADDEAQAEQAARGLQAIGHFTQRGWLRAAMRHAQSQREALRLWVFQRDRRAQSFYRSLGFQVVETSDGQDNDYNLPEMMLIWRRTDE